MNMLRLNRAQLGAVFKDHDTLRVFEQLNIDAIETPPSTIEEANALAGQAAAVTAQLLTMVAALAADVERLAAAPAGVPATDPDDTTPRAELGTMSAQNHDAVDITGGTAGLNAGTVGAPSLFLGGDNTTGLYRSAANALAVAIAGVKLVELSALLVDVVGSLRVSQQLISTVATGTAPLQVASTTLVANLHAAVADSLGAPGSYPANATDLPTAIALVNAIKAQNISKGV